MVRAFLRGLDILSRLDEVLTAPTGSAAAHIGVPYLYYPRRSGRRLLRGWQGNTPVGLEDKMEISSCQNTDDR